jgi:hypothetical protein
MVSSIHRHIAKEEQPDGLISNAGEIDATRNGGLNKVSHFTSALQSPTDDRFRSRDSGGATRTFCIAVVGAMAG